MPQPFDITLVVEHKNTNFPWAHALSIQMLHEDDVSIVIGGLHASAVYPGAEPRLFRHFVRGDFQPVFVTGIAAPGFAQSGADSQVKTVNIGYAALALLLRRLRHAVVFHVQNAGDSPLAVYIQFTVFFYDAVFFVGKGELRNAI